MREASRVVAMVKRHEIEASLIYFDLNNFKPINDAHGHAAGDAVMRAIGEILIRQTRETDIVGRIGGDEFAVVLTHVGADAAEIKAESLAAALCTERVLHNGEALYRHGRLSASPHVGRRHGRKGARTRRRGDVRRQGAASQGAGLAIWPRPRPMLTGREIAEAAKAAAPAAAAPDLLADVQSVFSVGSLSCALTMPVDCASANWIGAMSGSTSSLAISITSFLRIVAERCFRSNTGAMKAAWPPITQCL